MSSVNKQSVRDEFDSLKSSFKKLADENKVSPECLPLFNSLIVLFELLLAIFMEKKTKKTANNSGIPPSQTEEDTSALGQTGSKGKGKKEIQTQAANTRTVETVSIASVSVCDYCGTALDDVPCQCHERRTRIDILFEKTIHHVDAEIKTCPACQKETKGRFPEDMHGSLQYGHGIRAYVIHLLVRQMVSLNRVQKMLTALINKTLSEATLLGFVLSLYYALEDWEKQARVALINSPNLHVDETSLRVNKKHHWIHVYSSGDVTLKCLHKKRGKEAMEAIGIIPRYHGVLIHDCWASYLSYGHCSHGLCGSHLLRELTFIVDSNGYRWAKNIKALLKEACADVSKSSSKVLDEKAYARLQRRYRNRLTRGEKELPAIPEKKKGRRGKVAKSDAHNLWERLQQYETSVLLFAKNPPVSFTNNRAERDLRMDKVKQKVSGCFRTEKFAKAYCRISSYLQTMANKGYNPIIAIQMALSGEIYNMRGE